MAIKSKIGLEAEYLLINDKNEIIVPPAGWDRDAFPLLGEIRGKEGKTMSQTVTNFKQAEMELMDRLQKDHSIRFAEMEVIKLALYKKANSQINWEDKNASLGKIKNIHGIDIETFSDQIVSKNKIQGVRISCGLHIHFSCCVSIETEYEIDDYEQVMLPIGLGEFGLVAAQRDGNEVPFTPAELLAKELLKPTIYLYRRKGYKKKDEYKLYASRLNKPAIHFIVNEMDKAFFDRFAPAKADRTKYRQPGFFELKPYGFEYRSLPANEATMTALPEITKKAFELLREINEY